MATDELTDTSTCCGPAAIVQSGGIQPVAAMPAKLAAPLGAAAGSRPASGTVSAIGRLELLVRNGIPTGVGAGLVDFGHDCGHRLQLSRRPFLSTLGSSRECL